MENLTDTQTIVAIAAVLAVLATVASPLIALWVGQRVSDRKASRDLKYRIFVALMSERFALGSTPDSVRLLNSVDIVFAENRAVRDAWADYFNAVSRYQIGVEVSNHEVDQLRIAVLRAIAHDLGLGRNLSNADLYRVYESTLLFRKRAVEQMETDLKYDQLHALRSQREQKATASPSTPLQSPETTAVNSVGVPGEKAPASVRNPETAPDSAKGSPRQR